MRYVLAAALLCSLGCEPGKPNNQRTWAPPIPTGDAKASGSAKPTTKPAGAAFAELDRATFNRAAQRLNRPIYWIADENKNKAVDPSEVAALSFFPEAGAWVAGGKFTPAFEKTYGELVLASRTKAAGREGLVTKELDAADTVLLHTDLRSAPAEEKAFIAQMLVVSKVIDELYGIQTGAAGVAAQVAKDPASQSLFRRNVGPKCVSPGMEKETGCTALVEATKVKVTVWPLGMQDKDDFCKTIESHADFKKLSTPFTVVKADGDKLTTVPYTEAFAEPMKRAAAELRKAATLLAADKEKPFIDYLEAAAAAFENNDWEAADEAWSRMNAQNSKYYLRVGPDETYWEPCKVKAGFHMSFARINQSLVELQKKLIEHQQFMEDELAKLIGDSYKPKKVGFKPPDAIEIVINAGDSRPPIAITGGQSLPNLGKVSEESRGRTVVMTNVYADADSRRIRREKATSLLTESAMKHYADAMGLGIYGTVLHEAAHNLGPSHEYKAAGKTDKESFGGDLASMLEELKAQTASYYYLYLLAEKGVFTEQQIAETILDNVVWNFGHVARGMVDGSGNRKPYSQLAAINLGVLMAQGAITWDPAAKAANGKDVGAFSVDLTKMKAASIEMMRVVGAIKAKGDKAGALALAKEHVEEGSKVPMAIITERIRRFPQPSFVYSIEL